MKGQELATHCGVSLRHIYNLRTRFPNEVPQDFNDVTGWKNFIEARRSVVDKKQHAPRATLDVQNNHSRYVAARARKVELQVEAAALDLEITKRNYISKNEYEAIQIFDGGGGVFEHNDLRGNKRGAWGISPDCLEKVKRERNLE